jgi:RNA polymerase sigma-70 factor, ECF subfamily
VTPPGWRGGANLLAVAGVFGVEALTDTELARLVVGGSPEEGRRSEAELCRRLGPRLRLYGLRHLRDAAAADDLVQEVLLLILQRLRAGRVREPERLASFALGACRLVVRNQRRGRRRREDLLDRFGGVLPSRVEPDVSRLDHRRLQSCLDTLGPRDRTVLVLTFYMEQTSAEIARELALSPDNVRAVRHRALVRLRGCVEGGGA